MAHNRVLIVGTIPYNKNTSSRAFDAYFHNWEKENIRQVFSNTKTPVKGHCGSLYQLTDQRMLKCWLGKTEEPGVIFEDKDLPVDWENNDLEVGNKLVDFLYKFGSKDTPLKYLARKILWKEKFWNTEKFRAWLDEFDPECVFLAFSDDFFIPEIALFIANRFNIPIMSCIGDDYYFNDKKSLSPFYHIYRKKYKKLIDRVFAHKGSAIYIGDKIRDKYNSEFGLGGETVYLTSEIERREFVPINTEEPRFVYCGNIRLGRNKSLAAIGKALYEINKNAKLYVYSAERDEKYIDILRKASGVEFCGAIPYTEVMKVTSECDASVIVEDFDEKNINITRYSLSTKAADAIASGSNIFVYGPMDCGVIEYMAQTGSAEVCTEQSELAKSLRRFIEDKEYQKKLYLNGAEILEQNHNKDKNCRQSERMFESLIERGKGDKYER